MPKRCLCQKNPTVGAFSTTTAKLFTADKLLLLAILERYMCGVRPAVCLHYHTLFHCLDCYLFRGYKMAFCVWCSCILQTWLVLLCITFMISRLFPHNWLCITFYQQRSWLGQAHVPLENSFLAFSPTFTLFCSSMIRFD